METRETKKTIDDLLKDQQHLILEEFVNFGKELIGQISTKSSYVVLEEMLLLIMA